MSGRDLARRPRGQAASRLDEWGRGAVALLPAADAPLASTVLFALGTGTIASVVVSTAEQLVRLLAQQRPPQIAGEPLAAAVGVAVAVAARGIDRAALWVVVVRAITIAGTFVALALTYAYVGRSALRDPLAAVGPAFAALVVGAAAGLVIGTVAAAALPRAPRAPEPLLLVRAVGVAIAVGAVVHLIWPTTFLVAASGATRGDDIRAVLAQLPELLAGPIAGGLYAANRGAGYTALLLLGALLAVPAALVELVIARALVEGATDPSVRGSLGLGVFLLALRVSAWPLAAAFARGFLTPPEPSPTVSEDL